MLLFTFYSPTIPERWIMFSTKTLSSTTVFNTDNKKRIRLISEGSFDTEDWSNI